MKTSQITPDKGYVWALLAAGFGSSILQADTFSTSGIFYSEYTERYEASRALAAWISGMKVLMMAVGCKYSWFMIML